MEQEILFPGDTLGIIGGNPNGIMLARTAKENGLYCSRFIVQTKSNPVLAEADVKMVGKLNEKQSFKILHNGVT